MAGPLLFAWVDPEDNLFAESAHAIEDEDVVTYELSQKEGDFAALSLEIRNPRVGLLGPGRKFWAWFSFDTGGSGGVKPLFFGRLIALPTDFAADACRLEFVARPQDFDEQKRALAETLKVAPWWDPIWISEEERDNPDSVLEARAFAWHIDPVNHVVSVSDQMVGEDGTLSFDMETFAADSLQTTVGQAPLRKVRIEAEVHWTQAAQGTLNIKVGSGNLITSYSGDGLADDWPKEGGSIGGGWEFGPCSIKQMDGILFAPIYFVTFSDYSTIHKGYGDDSWSSYSGNVRILAQLYHHAYTLSIRYDAKRERVEKLSFDLEADVQALLTEPGEEEALTRSLSSVALAQVVDPVSSDDPGIPIGDVRRRDYFPTDRGRRSVEWLIALARAELLRRARAVEVSIQVPFTEALDLSLRKNAIIYDDRLPGGQAAGKVVGYRLYGSGDDNFFAAEFTVGCMIGQGNTVTATPGTPDYVEEGVLESGIQHYTGQTIMPIPGEVTYGDYSEEPNDDGLNFFALTASQVINSLSMINGPDDQEDILNGDGHWLDASEVLTALKAAYTRIRLRLKPVDGGPYVTEYVVPVSDLMVPKLIDLESVA